MDLTLEKTIHKEVKAQGAHAEVIGTTPQRETNAKNEIPFIAVKKLHFKRLKTTAIGNAVEKL